MALALYRKYRPATFGEVVGQEHVTEPLRTALASGRINHAYLFSGPRGCGKTSSARILARSLNCLHGPTAEPCGECDSCVALAPEGPGSVDVIELDAASHGGVDDTRELRDRAVFAPAQSRYRIFVIDEAHMVTPQGFNALLKIVEEPPEHLVFIFATTEPDKVLTTIRSRTHHYPFRLMPPGTMRELLERICGEEGVRVESTVYPLAIRAGGGSARDTLSVFDQLLAGAGDEGITYDRAVALLGVTDVALINDMVDALAAGDGAAVYGTVDRLVEAGHDPRRFASDLLDRLRDLVLLNAVPDAAQRGLVDGGGDDLATMQSQGDRLGAATLSRFAEIVHTGLSEMRGATAPRLLLELLCARMLLPTVSAEETALLQRLERVERRMTIAPPESSSSGEHAETAGPEPGSAPAEPESGPPRRVFQRPHERAAQQHATQQQAAQQQAAQQQAAETGASASGPATGKDTPAEKPPAESTSAESTSAENGRYESEGVQSGRQQGTAEPAPSEQDATAARQQPTETRSAQPPEGHAESGATSGGLDAAAVRRVWTELLRAVAERHKPTQALLLNATVQDLRDGTLVLSMPTTGLLKQFAQQHRVEFVRDAMRAVLGGEWQVQCVEEGAAAAQQGGQAAGDRAQARPSQAAPSPGGSSPGGWTRQQESRGPQDSSAHRASAEWSGETRGEQPSAGSPGQENRAASNGVRPEAGSPSEHGSVPPPPEPSEPPDEQPPPEPLPPEPPPEPLPPEPPDEEPPPEDVPPPQEFARQQEDAVQSAEPELAGTASPAPASRVAASHGESAASSPGGAAEQPQQETQDPQEAAVELFASELGARRIEDT
ncbi:DNA polymerase III subunit gamma and tau [Haloactinomyces albus]|uniref:DNA polymerase III subunit gamma/tau n=1 Tax=Haloactinomyces albus TaxID=1352928 RepID=A0AAE3ZF01_9ACTN|nr:DNA polymerase III subunit gamma and tau [Haloactinomyces albus]MDR7301799.1 DNA polymerase-3 subunit gamma/tau [Haloactinomyces albus]